MIFSAFIGSEYKPRPPGSRPFQTGERKRVQSRGNEQHGCKHENQSDLTLAGCIKGTQMRSQSLKTFFYFNIAPRAVKVDLEVVTRKMIVKWKSPIFLCYMHDNTWKKTGRSRKFFPRLGSMFLDNFI